jgi:hypothetical protein
MPINMNQRDQQIAGAIERAHNLLRAIQAEMDGKEWTPETLDAIARLLEDGGYPIREPKRGTS